MPTPRKQQSRAELIRRLLPADDAPETYIDVYESILRQDGSNSGRRIPAAGIAKLFAMARLDADAQATIMAVVAPGNASDVTLGQNEFNVLLALVGLAQEGDVISLDSVDERKSSKLKPFPPMRHTTGALSFIGGPGVIKHHPSRAINHP